MIVLGGIAGGLATGFGVLLFLVRYNRQELHLPETRRGRWHPYRKHWQSRWHTSGSLRLGTGAVRGLSFKQALAKAAAAA